jgi:hypothetical protein
MIDITHDIECIDLKKFFNIIMTAVVVAVSCTGIDLHQRHKTFPFMKTFTDLKLNKDRINEDAIIFFM